LRDIVARCADETSAAAVSERRRAPVMAMEFGAKSIPTP
jgi:hypothetical protein